MRGGDPGGGGGQGAAARFRGCGGVEDGSPSERRRREGVFAAWAGEHVGLRGRWQVGVPAARGRTVWGTVAGVTCARLAVDRRASSVSGGRGSGGVSAVSDDGQ